MDTHEIEILSNKQIPETVREKVAERIYVSKDLTSTLGVERERLEAEKRKFLWNTPLVIALTGLLTLSATFLFDNLTNKQETASTRILEEIRAELSERDLSITRGFP
jgi:hypothetical protein